jgi:hypothetical protein
LSAAHEIALVEADLGSPLRALTEAVDARHAGRAFALRVPLDDERSAIAREVASAIVTEEADYDRRRGAFDALADGSLKMKGRLPHSGALPDAAAMATLRVAAKLADAFAVRSYIEYDRVRYAMGLDAPPLLIEPETIPLPERPDVPLENAAVIWAPEYGAAEIRLLASAFEELKVKATAVVRDGVLHGFGNAVVAADAGRALASARVIVDAQTHDPSQASALSALGKPLVVASTSGADELLEGVATYDPWSRRSVVDAVLIALGSAPPRRRERVLSEFSPAAFVQGGPLVSVVVKTRDRPDFLERALAGLAAQTYRDLEIVVVNDGGCDVADIVARIPHVHHIVLERSHGPAAAGNIAVQAANGTYLSFLDDDDEVFPDHIAALVTALESAPAAQAAVAETLTAYSSPRPDGTYEMTGYAMFLDGLAETTELYLGDALGPMALLLRRSLFDGIGGYDERVPRAIDWDLLIRVAAAGDVVHVRKVTACYHVREDGSNMMSYAGAKMPAALKYFEQKYPTPERPLLGAARTALRERVERQHGEPRWPQPALRLR